MSIEVKTRPLWPAALILAILLLLAIWIRASQGEPDDAVCVDLSDECDEEAGAGGMTMMRAAAFVPGGGSLFVPESSPAPTDVANPVSDGTKFGKTESGNVWLDPRYTSPYKFYQFWLNVSDEDAKRYIKIFTLLDRETIEALIAEHEAAPHLRVLQKRLAQEITTMIHSKEEYEKAVEASAILFGGATSEALHRLDEQTLLQVFEGVPQFRIARSELGSLPFVELAAEKTQVFPSKGECRKMVQGGGVSLNKEKVTDPMRPVTEEDLIAGKYLLVQRGKKNYYLVIAE